MNTFIALAFIAFVYWTISYFYKKRKEKPSTLFPYTATEEYGEEYYEGYQRACIENHKAYWDAYNETPAKPIGYTFSAVTIPTWPLVGTASGVCAPPYTDKALPNPKEEVK